MTYTKLFANEMRAKNLEGNFPDGIACGCMYRISWIENSEKFFVLVDVQGKDAELIDMKSGEKIKANLLDISFVDRIDNRERYKSVTKRVTIQEIKKRPSRHIALIWEDLADFTANNTLKDSIRYFHLYSREISDAIITAAHGIDREIKNKKLRAKMIKVINNNIPLHDPRA